MLVGRDDPGNASDDGMSELGKLELLGGSEELAPCLVFHHCMDICASISSIFLSVMALSSGLEGKLL